QENKNPVSERLSQLELADAPSPASPAPSAEQAIPRLASSKTVQGLEKSDPRKKLRERIVQAGLYKPNALPVFIAARLICCLVPVAIGFSLSGLGILTPSKALTF